MQRLPKTTFIVTSVLFSFLSFAQTNGSSSNIEKHIPFEIFRTQEKNLTIQDVLRDTSLFRPISDYSEKTHPDDIFWIRLDISKEQSFSKKDSSWYLAHNSFDYADLYYLDNQTFSKTPVGRFDPNTAGEQIKSAKYFSETKINSNYIIDGALYLKVKRVQFIENLTNWEFEFTKNSTKDLLTWNDIQRILYSYVFSGIAVLMTIIMLLFFGYFKRWEFVMYSVYTLFMFIYAIKDEFIFSQSFLPNRPLLKVWLYEDITFFVGIVYLLFAIYYLNLKKDYRLIYYVIVFSLYLHGIFLLIDFLFYFFENYTAHIFLMKALPIADSLFSTLIAIYILVKAKNLLGYLFVLGFTMFMIGTGIHFYLNNEADPMGHYNKLPLYIGSALEIIIFAFGLIYKIFQEHLERLNFEQEAFRNKNKALRAQLNPHFIFNALGSIQHLILNKKNTTALKYLSQFSRLARNVLESSIELHATLEEEIKMLKDYLELESLRFDKAFSYDIQIETQLATSEIDIPFMISQPFVENAIIHGLLPKQSGTKKLTIIFKEEEQALLCIIDDTGVGRNCNKTSLKRYQNKGKSRGLDVTYARLKSWSYGPGKVEIIDKLDDNSNPLGTKIIITIPID